MKTHDEIKKGLECCARLDGCKDCPYSGEKCVVSHTTDTLAYIQQLEAEIDRVYKLAKSLEQPGTTKKGCGTMFAWAVCNCVIIACFTALAIYFDKWWIVLFAMLLTFGYKSKKDDEQNEG